MAHILFVTDLIVSRLSYFKTGKFTGSNPTYYDTRINIKALGLLASISNSMAKYPMSNSKLHFRNETYGSRNQISHVKDKIIFSRYKSQIQNSKAQNGGLYNLVKIRPKLDLTQSVRNK